MLEIQDQVAQLVRLLVRAWQHHSKRHVRLRAHITKQEAREEVRDKTLMRAQGSFKSYLSAFWGQCSQWLEDTPWGPASYGSMSYNIITMKSKILAREPLGDTLKTTPKP
jgi:hypothetical protein